MPVNTFEEIFNTHVRRFASNYDVGMVQLSRDMAALTRAAMDGSMEDVPIMLTVLDVSEAPISPALVRLAKLHKLSEEQAAALFDDWSKKVRRGFMTLLEEEYSAKG